MDLIVILSMQPQLRVEAVEALVQPPAALGAVAGGVAVQENLCRAAEEPVAEPEDILDPAVKPVPAVAVEVVAAVKDIVPVICSIVVEAVA
jgi:hypothetical protein